MKLSQDADDGNSCRFFSRSADALSLTRVSITFQCRSTCLIGDLRAAETGSGVGGKSISIDSRSGRTTTLTEVRGVAALV